MNLSGPNVRNGRARVSSPPPPGPFGYSFFSPPDTPYEPAPAPPPGPALLDDNESSMLDNFFTTMNSTQLDTSDGWFGGQQGGKGSGTFNIEWPEELPPTFEGSTTSLSQPSLLPHNMERRRVNSMNNDMGTSSDILAAASMLGMNGGGFGSTFTHQLFPDHAFTGMNGNFSATGGSIKNTPSSDRLSSKESSPQLSRKPLTHGLHTPMFFDVQQPTLDQQTSAKVRTLRWGSDSAFMDQGYMAPPNQPNEEERTRELLDKLECLEPQSSTANTRAPSPVAPDRNGDHAGLNGHQLYSSLRNEDRDEIGNESQPRKRQKSEIKEEEGGDNDVNGLKSNSKKSKGSSNVKSQRSSNDSLSRKPKPRKPVRENLTEEQKRTNHILSEQKRRNLIKQGFEELCSIVPELRSGGFSKSAILMQAADWLEGILRGNEILKAQLAELKAMDGLAMPR
ncbi:putative HLH transcription factor [Thermoascus aurantiacus ATCC 26904]